MGTSQSVTFNKTITPTYASMNQTAYVYYHLSHTRSNETITSALVTDSLFTQPGLIVQQISGGTITNDQISFDLPSDGLPSNQIITIMITLLISPDTSPSSTRYATSAQGDFILSWVNPVSIVETTRFEINAAVLSVQQEVIPTPPVPFGSSFTIIITITNIGNAKAQIAAKRFIDYWDPDFIRISSISDSRFITSQASVINGSTINLQPTDTLTFQINAQLLDPSAL